MTEISEAERRAMERCNRGNKSPLRIENWRTQVAFGELVKTIQQASDTAKAVRDGLLSTSFEDGWPVTCEEVQSKLAPLILPDPVDPLEEALGVAGKFSANSLPLLPGYAATVRAELAKRGLQIVPVQP